MNTTTNTTNNNDNNQNAGNDISLSLSLFSLSLSEDQEREKASFCKRELISFSLSPFLSGRFSKLQFRVTNETLTLFSALLSSKGKKITSKPHKNRRAFSAPRKEFFVAPLLRRRRKRRKRVFLGVLCNPFLSKTLAFLAQEEAEAKEIISLVCVLVFENSKRKHSSRRRETPRCSVCCRSSSSSKKERVIRERERESGRSALRF